MFDAFTNEGGFEGRFDWEVRDDGVFFLIRSLRDDDCDCEYIPSVRIRLFGCSVLFSYAPSRMDERVCIWVGQDS